MILKLNWKYAKGEFETKAIQMVDIPARPTRGEKNAEIALQDNWNYAFAEIRLGDVESSNAFAKELVRRWNEFPEKLKQ